MTLSALAIRQLSKKYGDFGAVRDLSFNLPPGEIFGLLGPNGAGKSTTINMIAGVTRIGSGTVEIFGYDNQRQYRDARRLVGVMHQEIVIDNFFTIDQALRFHSGYYGVPDDPRWRGQLIERLGLGPHLHKIMIKLSGGLKRRFMVAKALIHRPPLLILDEPTAGVDVELRHSLWDFVREINRAGTTILLTTHYLEEAEQMCGRLAIMNRGELIALEPTVDLLERLGGRELRITLAEPVVTLPDELATLPARLGQDGRTLAIPLDGEPGPGEILAILCRSGVTVTDIETHRSGLEDVFLKLTGLANAQEKQ